MKKLFTILIYTFICISLISSCERLCSHRWDKGVEVEGGEGGYVMEYTCLGCGDKHQETITIIPPEGDIPDNENIPSVDDDQFTAYINQVTKEEFQKLYSKAYNTLQPDYKNDFIYIYTNNFKEVHEGGEDIQSTVEHIEFDADSEIVLRHYEFKDIDETTPANESYFWEYVNEGETIRFYDSRTDEVISRDFVFEEFWEFAKNQVPLVFLPNPNKLYNDSTYYVDQDEDGNTVFTLYSADENSYSLRQVIFSGTEMIYRTKSYTKEADYEDTTIDIFRVFNEDVTITPHS